MLTFLQKTVYQTFIKLKIIHVRKTMKERRCSKTISTLSQRKAVESPFLRTTEERRKNDGTTTEERTKSA